MATLPTNFKDDILDTSVNARRRYRMYENTDGTIELEDVTEYSQVGDAFGAGQINSTNTEVNKKFDKNMIVRDLDIISAITKEGYVPDALAIKEVNDSLQWYIDNGFLPPVGVLFKQITTSSVPRIEANSTYTYTINFEAESVSNVELLGTSPDWHISYVSLETFSYSNGVLSVTVRNSHNDWLQDNAIVLKVYYE